MKMKRVLTAEEIAGIAFRKQNVNQPLEQKETGENAPATSGNKRKAAEASQSQQKKKKLTPKQREDKRNDNFVPIEPRSADLPPPSSGHAEETHHTPPRVNPDLEATAESKDKTIHLDSESTPTPPHGSFRLANLAQLTQTSAENAAEQSAFLQQIFPAEFRNQLAALPFNQALNAFVQNGLVFFGMVADQARRSTNLYQVALRKETELGLLQAGVDQVKKDRDAAEEARKAVELTAAETKTALIEERKKNRELVMDSGPVTDEFNAYVDAVKDHEVNKAVLEVIQACSLTPPYPDAVQKKLKEGTAAALLEAENATTTIPIPLIDAFAADPNMPIDGFLKEDF
ncbi:uncharacterized protein [Rutidosis leptorrhynchoides]|uniref:uncharacterized protein n=1 Tax=Rutidosis leptorrhynchoides TaxID=125765 RepID=UPI003A997AA7